MHSFLRCFCTAAMLVGSVGAVAPSVASPVPGKAAAIYLVSASSTPAVDITLTDYSSVQLLTILVEKKSGGARAVLTDGEGSILQVRSIEESTDLDLQPLPVGTYRVAVLNAAGALLAQQTFVKR